MARNRNADAPADAAPATEAQHAPDLAGAYDAVLQLNSDQAAQIARLNARIAELEAALERNDAALKALASAPAATPAANPYQFHPQARTFVFCKGPYSAAGDIRRIKALNQQQAEVRLATEVGDPSGFAFRGCLG